MIRRRACQYCQEPLNRLASLLRIQVTCRTCAWRMSMGGSPWRPPEPPAENARLAAADREWTEGRLQARLDTAVEEIAAMRPVVEAVGRFVHGDNTDEDVQAIVDAYDQMPWRAAAQTEQTEQ